MKTVPASRSEVECVMIQCLKCGFVFMLSKTTYTNLKQLPQHPHARQNGTCTCDKFKRHTKPTLYEVEQFFPTMGIKYTM